MTDPSFRNLPSRKLLWAFARGMAYSEVPAWLAESLRTGFPQFDSMVTSDAETILREIGDAEIYISWTLKPELFGRAQKLRWIHSPAAGVTQLLFPAVVESDVIVTNSTTVHSVPVAEQAVALLFALARRFRSCFDDQAAHRWAQKESWEPSRIPTELNGKTLGLVGFGAIGREVAQRARALGMTVIAVKRDPSRGAELADRVYSPRDLPALLEQADYLLLAAPGNPETRHMIGEAQLRRMKPSAALVNVARGTLVDTDALVRVLEAGKLAGAGLDVTDPEPLPSEHPLWRLPNVIITPHLAGATDRYWQRQRDMVCENLRRYLAGEPLLNRVDKRRGY
jgi:phosphoglycerate dehydrogenase-like enzyme